MKLLRGALALSFIRATTATGAEVELIRSLTSRR